MLVRLHFLNHLKVSGLCQWRCSRGLTTLSPLEAHPQNIVVLFKTFTYTFMLSEQQKNTYFSRMDHAVPLHTADKLYIIGWSSKGVLYISAGEKISLVEYSIVVCGQIWNLECPGQACFRDGQSIKWYMMDDTSHLIPKTRHLTPGNWHLTPDTWHLTPDTWHMTHDTWHQKWRQSNIKSDIQGDIQGTLKVTSKVTSKLHQKWHQKSHQQWHQKGHQKFH